MQDFLTGLGGGPGPVAVVSHGGVTTDLLRTLLGDAALPPGLLAEGIPSCAITTLDDLQIVTDLQMVTDLQIVTDLHVVTIASTGHLRPP